MSSSGDMVENLLSAHGVRPQEHLPASVSIVEPTPRARGRGTERLEILPSVGPHRAGVEVSQLRGSASSGCELLLVLRCVRRRRRLPSSHLYRYRPRPDFLRSHRNALLPGSSPPPSVPADRGGGPGGDRAHRRRVRRDVPPLSPPPVQVGAINIWAPDNVCGLNANPIYYSGFNGSTGAAQAVDFEIPNFNGSLCTVAGVTTNTSGFALSQIEIPLPIPAEGNASMNITITSPSSSFSGDLNLVFS